MDNASIAAVLKEMAQLLEFRGENPFRIRAYENGARAVENADESIADIAADPDRDLAGLAGIGKTLATKIHTLLDSGTLPQLQQLREEVPEVVLEIARIPGLGAKKAIRLRQELDIESLQQLEAACHQGQVAALKGFGKKTESMILEGLAIAKAASERMKWIHADQLAAEIEAHLKAAEPVGGGPLFRQMQWAGSYRRGRETVGDLDLLAVATDREAAMDRFEAFPGRVSTTGRGDTKISIRVGKAFQVDMRLVAADQFGAALQYFTGSQAHNIHLRRIAKQRGLKINEYGVFRVDDQTRIASENEADVYAALDLPTFPPEIREDRIEFRWAEQSAEQPAGQRTLPELIRVEDMRGDLHMHTSASDGQNTIREMADAAIARGLQYIAITDHSKRVSMASGLDGSRLRQQWQMIEEIRPEYEGRLILLKGIECDILEAGGMDLPDEVLAEADWVLASVHYGQKQPREQITERILNAIENPHVDCIAHPTGRLILRRDPYQVDLDEVLHAAVQHDTLMELNANPARLDLNDVNLAKARRLGVGLVINTDAHTTDGLDVMRYGVLQARRAGLTAAEVANTQPFDAFVRRGRS